jgi:hypothetical protein
MKKARITDSHGLSGILALVALAAVLTMGGCTPTQSEKASSGNTPFSDPKALAEEFKTPTPLTQTSIRYWFLTDNASDEQMMKSPNSPLSACSKALLTITIMMKRATS